ELEEAAMDILQNLGYETLYGPDIAPDGENPERTRYEEPVLIKRLQDTLSLINPNLPSSVIEDAIKQIQRVDSPNLLVNNRNFHRMLIEGIPIEYRSGGRNRTALVKVIDFDNPEGNEFVAINQYTVVEGVGGTRYTHRPDIVLFINGIPIVVIELKNPADENTTVKKAYYQLQTYKDHIPSLFRTNELLVISDGYEAKCGSLSANWERFMPWRTIEGDFEAESSSLQMEVLFRGVLDHERLLDYIRYFITFEDDERGNLIKKSAAYHQFHAVNRGIEETLRATSEDGDRKIGVVWHTQGSGKSLTMLFYAGKLIQKLENPTILVLTDRNDLDNQLYSTFAMNRDLLRQDPQQAETRADIRELLKTTGGGVIFSTIQKFLPEGEGQYPILSERRNIIVIADEAHRSQYSFQRSVTLKYDEDDTLQEVMTKEGFAAHIRHALPNASYIGFTGTPIDLVDRNTVHVFGDYISVYDISRAIEDKTT
ncbi:MAG: type I restriction endonuclease subunit R, partial [Gammaproteobacteria bacterium]